jgi:hypothetical protein
MIDQEGLATLHVAEQQEVRINIERRKLEIQIDIKIHSMEWLFVITNVEPLWGHVWTPIENDVFQYQKILAFST